MFDSFSDFVGSWASALSVDTGGGFAFEDVRGGLASLAESWLDSGAQSEPKSTIWFQNVDDKPANRPLPHGAKKVIDSGLIAVQSVDIKYFNLQAKHIMASLERNDGTAQTDFDMFGPGSLSVDDLNTVRVGKESSDLTHSLGLPFDIESSTEFQSLCCSLWKTSQFPE